MPRYHGRHRHPRRFPPLITTITVLVAGSGAGLLAVAYSDDPELSRPPRQIISTAPAAPSPPVKPYVKEYRAPSSSLNATLKLAKAQVGISGRPNKFTRWYSAEIRGGLQTAPWCAIFLAWVTEHTGADAPDDAYTPTMAEDFVKVGHWGTKPRIGAYVFFDWGGSKSRTLIDHVGLVVKVHKDGSVSSVEGNASDLVAIRRHATSIVGFGYPDYTSRG